MDPKNRLNGRRRGVNGIGTTVNGDPNHSLAEKARVSEHLQYSGRRATLFTRRAFEILNAL
jgi:hypothetical protein